MRPAQPDVDRLSIRRRPGGFPVMHQNWGKLLFLHWPIAPDALRPLIPPPLDIDTFDDQAWLTIAPFTMWGIRPMLLPPLPFLSQAHELNVRTYVHHRGVPGVWFLSLDLNHALGVRLARLAYHLPYFDAEIRLSQEGQEIHYAHRRTHRGAPSAEFDARWAIEQPLPESQPGSGTFFLTERYCLYSASRGRLFGARIWHQPWKLHEARLLSLRSTMIECHGLESPRGDPLLHYAESIRVEVWPLRRVQT